MPNLTDLQTPSLILDRERLDRNLAKMLERARVLGVNLRPHVKTAKCIEVVRRAIAGQAGGITVSTLKEAEQFFAAGFADILYAVCIAPNKLHHVADLRRRGANLVILLDSIEAAEFAVAKGRELGADFPALIEIDCDGHRSGVQPEAEQLGKIGRVLGPNLRGVLVHAGDSYNGKSVDAIRRLAERERVTAVQGADELRRAGLTCSVVSVGSTPTAMYAERLDGVTEVRAGVFMFFDLVMAGLGVCQSDDIALSVLTTVIGHQPHKNWIITDAGWMALSRDRGTSRQQVDYGYGAVCSLAGNLLTDLVVTDTSQEHGIITARYGVTIDLARYPIGTRLRILPNHACATAAQHASYQVVNGGTDIEDVWLRFDGW